jgi:hypothetical protein
MRSEDKNDLKIEKGFLLVIFCRNANAPKNKGF